MCVFLNQLGPSESSYKTKNCVHPASCHHYDGARQGFRERKAWVTDCHIDVSCSKSTPVKCLKRMKTIAGLKTAVGLKTTKQDLELSRTNTAVACLIHVSLLYVCVSLFNSDLSWLTCSSVKLQVRVLKFLSGILF